MMYQTYRSIFCTNRSQDNIRNSNMKFFICAFALVAMALAAPQNYNNQVLSKEGNAAILAYSSDQKDDGAYEWSFKTENGINAGETNQPKPAGPNGEPAPNVAGGYDYTAPNGEVVSIRYNAGEQGFVAEGSHIPVAPPIPAEILESLAWNAAHPEEEAQWDPAYKSVAAAQPIYGR